MPTVVDSLIVSLGLDASKFSAAQRQAVADFKKTQEASLRTATAIEEQGKRAAEFFRRIRNEAIALFTVFLGARGIEEFTRKITTADNALGYMARNAGVSVRYLSTLENAVSMIGGTAGDADQAVMSLAQTFQELRYNPQSAVAKSGVMQIFGLTPQDLQNVPAALEKIHNKMQGMSGAQAQYLGALLNIPPWLINLLQRADFAKIMAEGRAGAASQEDAAAAQQRYEAFTKVGQKFVDIGRAILTDVSPAIIDLLNRLDMWLKKNQELIKSKIVEYIKDFATWLKSIDWDKVANGISTFATEADKVAKALGGWKDVTEAIFLLWAGSKFVAFLGALRTAAGILAAMAGSVTTIVTGLAITLKGDTPGADVPGGQGSPEQLRQNQKELEQFNREHPPGSKSWWQRLKERFGGAVSPGAYHPGAQYDGGGSGASVVDYLVSQGLTPEQARGATAGLYAESKLNPNAVNPTSGAYGIAQWLGPRKRALFAKYGNHPNLSQQLEFLVSELRGGDPGGRSVLRAGSELAALMAFIKNLERPAPGAETSGDLARGGAFLEHLRHMSPNSGRGRNGGGSISSETNVNGDIHIHTKADNAQGIAKGIRPALERYADVSRANFGLA